MHSAGRLGTCGLRITRLFPITSGYDGQGSTLLYLLNEVICRCVPRDEIPCPTASRQPDFVVQAGRLGTCDLRITRLLPITSGYDGQGSPLLYLLNEVICRCVPRTGLEPATYGLEVRCSIQLSYRGILKNFSGSEAGSCLSAFGGSYRGNA